MEKQQGSAASPQAEDGFIRIASEIVEALCKVNLSAYESRVLWFILRKTYGWQKKTDWISLSQFSKGTGLDKRHVHRTLKRLQEREIVIRNGDSQRPHYGLQKDYTRWKASSLQGTGACRGDRVSPVEVIRVSPVEAPTIDTITKDTLTKDTPLPPKNGGGGWLKNLFSEKHKKHSGEDYPWKRKEERLVGKDEGYLRPEIAGRAIDIYLNLRPIGNRADDDLNKYGYNYIGFNQRLSNLIAVVKGEEDSRRWRVANSIKARKEQEEGERRLRELKRLEQKLEVLPEDERKELRQKAEAAVKAKHNGPFPSRDISVHREMLNMLKGEEMAAVSVTGL